MSVARSCFQKQENAWSWAGDAKRTTQNLKVVKILPEKNLVLVKGSVPGSKGTVVTVRIAKKYKAK